MNNERRGHRRFLAQRDAVVMFGSHHSEVGQIIDFGKDESAFRYIGYGPRLKGSSET